MKAIFWLTMWVCFPYITGGLWLGGFVWGVLKVHFASQNELLEVQQEILQEMQNRK